MTNYALLNNVDHQDLKIITRRSADYGDNVMFVPTFPFEFRDVQTHYPILIHRDDKGAYYPIALFGFENGENLFLDGEGWTARYVPAMIRREPFLIGYQGAKDGAQGDPERMLSIDMDHPRISRDEGEPLFQPLGGRTPFLEEMAGLMETIYHGLEQSRRFTAVLDEYGLIESITMDIALKDGSRNQLVGFYGVNEEKVQQLGGDALQRLAGEGHLMPLFMMLASLSNIRTLVEMRNQRLGD